MVTEIENSTLKPLLPSKVKVKKCDYNMVNDIVQDKMKIKKWKTKVFHEFFNANPPYMVKTYCMYRDDQLQLHDHGL